MRRDRLAAWLIEHVPADAEEAGHVCTVLAALAGEPDPFDRRTFAPGHVTASAFVLAPTGDAVLLILHGALGLWLQPGGHVEAQDADIVAAARREVEEETGLTSLELLPGYPRLLDVDVHAIPPRPSRGEGEHLHLDVRVAFRAQGATLAPGAEVNGARWVAFDDVAAAGADRSVLRALGRTRAIASAAPKVVRPASPAALDPRAEALLRWWFGEGVSPTPERRRAWWSHDAAVDAEVARRFGALHAEAAAGGLDTWAGSPRGRLALVLALDQLSRHLHRDAPGMFAQDEAAARLTTEGVAAGELDQLGLYERLFLLMPWMHAEDLRLQHASVAAFRQLADDAARAGDGSFADNVAFAVRHREIVARFGHFPHRNAILGRSTSAEAAAFLAEPGSSF